MYSQVLKFDFMRMNEETRFRSGRTLFSLPNDTAGSAQKFFELFPRLLLKLVFALGVELYESSCCGYG